MVYLVRHLILKKMKMTTKKKKKKKEALTLAGFPARVNAAALWRSATLPDETISSTHQHTKPSLLHHHLRVKRKRNRSVTAGSPLHQHTNPHPRLLVTRQRAKANAKRVPP
jgi:hypothetical protein